MTGRNTFGSIRKKASGKWQARYRDNRGQDHYRSFLTKGEAAAFLARVQADMSRDEWVDPGLGRITVKDWADFYINNRTLRPRTESLYRSVLRNHILPTFGAWPLATVTPTDVQAWVGVMKANKDFGPVTTVRALRLLSQMFRMAVRLGRIPHNPCDAVEPPKEPKRKTLFLQPDQVVTLSEVIGKDHPPFSTLVLLAAYSGLRWGECVGLGVQHVNPLHRTVDVVRQMHPGGRLDAPKSDQGHRTVKVPEWLAARLAQTVAARQPAKGLPPELADMIFLTPKGKPLTHPSNFGRRRWHPAVETALPEELHGLRFHDLRHTAVALYLDGASKAGQVVNAKALQQRMGHSTIRLTLDRYGHLLEGHDDETVAGMADPFAVVG